VGAWINNDIANVGKIDEANGNTRDVFHVVKTCEDRDAKVLADLQKPWYKFW
jgi:hypothetical protein